MRKLGCRTVGNQPSCPGIGGRALSAKQDKPALLELFDRFPGEQREAMLADVDGTGFAYEMFLTELGNHEFAVTGDLEETLSACGLSEQEVVENPGLGQPLYEEIAKCNSGGFPEPDEYAIYFPYSICHMAYVATTE